MAKSSTGVSSNTHLANTATDLEGETEAIRKAAQKRTRLNTKAVTSKDAAGAETTTLRLSGVAREDDNDSSGDENLISSIWGCNFDFDCDDSDADGAGSSKRRKSATSSTPRKARAVEDGERW